MPKNRMTPYGYKIEGGKIALHPQEAEIIRRIYNQYAAGLSYKRIAEELTQAGIRYMPDKPTWNKNMIARILQNKSYAGENQHPAIIAADEQQSAEQAQKPYTHTESQDIKLLKPLLVCSICGAPVKRRIKTTGGERWYCPTDVEHITTALTDEILLQSIEALQNQLSEPPKQARSHSGYNQIDLATVRLQNEIDHALTQPELNLAEIERHIIALAAQKYALTQDISDDTELEKTIKVLIGRPLQSRPLQSKLLKNITKHIEIKGKEAVALLLKNDQKIQPHAAGKGADDHAGI